MKSKYVNESDSGRLGDIGNYNRNSLSAERSTYLRKHASDPIHWHPWHREVLSYARKKHMPIFLSIGYSACHWCNVMHEETFKDRMIADILNRYFISIKVDRESRPDLDKFYMNALHNMGIQGGWPMNLFLLPDQKPFYGGTYFTRDIFKSIITSIPSAYSNHYTSLEESADAFIVNIESEILLRPKAGIYADKLGSTDDDSNVERGLDDNASIVYREEQESYRRIIRSLDLSNGGIMASAKFPLTSLGNYLIDYYRKYKDPEALRHLITFCDSIVYRGLYDHVGGGFYRYTEDEAWTRPHFEKMLYDNALICTMLSNTVSLLQSTTLESLLEALGSLTSTSIDAKEESSSANNLSLESDMDESETLSLSNLRLDHKIKGKTELDFHSDMDESETLSLSNLRLDHKIKGKTDLDFHSDMDESETLSLSNLRLDRKIKGKTDLDFHSDMDEVVRTYRIGQYLNAINRTISFLRDEFLTIGGLYISSLDADSDSGREGSYYLWSDKDIESALSKDGQYTKADVEQYFHLDEFAIHQIDRQASTTPGRERSSDLIYDHSINTVDHRSQPHIVTYHLNQKEDHNPLGDEKKYDILDALSEYRDQRPRPSRDTKAICSWNCMLVEAFYEMYYITQDNVYLEYFEELLSSIQNTLLLDDQCQVLHMRSCDIPSEEPRTLDHTPDDDMDHDSSNLERAKQDSAINNRPTYDIQLLEDYAYVINTLIHAYDISLDPQYLSRANEWTKRSIELFYSNEASLFKYSISVDAPLTADNIYLDDEVIDSPNTLMLRNLRALSIYYDNKKYQAIAETISDRLRVYINLDPTKHLGAARYAYLPTRPQVICKVIGPKSLDWIREVRKRSYPSVFISGAKSWNDIPLFDLRYNKLEQRDYPEDTIRNINTDTHVPSDKEVGNNITDPSAENTYAYICNDKYCFRPMDSLDDIVEKLDHFCSSIAPLPNSNSSYMSTKLKP